ncbi:MAG: hypothetical protein U9N86_02845 [Bacteroidota bacterium]|nr:hypothetical protein [Bacteroidota bacterium]
MSWKCMPINGSKKLKVVLLLDKPQTTFPEIMIAEQVALYLQLKLSTVRNKRVLANYHLSKMPDLPDIRNLILMLC